MKKRFAMMLVLVVALVMGMIHPISNVTVEAASMKLSSTKVTIVKGKQKKLSVKNLPSTSTVKWSTSDKKVATVSSKGTVTAKKAGKATITATITAKSGKQSKLTCKVTVKAATVVNSKYRYVGVVYEGYYDLTISKVDKNGAPTEIIVFGEKIKLKNQKIEDDGWSAETEKGGYIYAYFEKNYEKMTIKGNYGGDYKRTDRTNNDPIKTDKTIMKINDNIEIEQGDTRYEIRIRTNKSNSYYLTKTVISGDNRKETQDTYPVTQVCKGDGWSFDCTTCTLTLNNASLKNIYTTTSCDMTVNLIGENVICNDLPDGALHSYQIGFFSNMDGVDKVNVIFTGDGSANFCRPDWYKDQDDLSDSIGLRLFENPLILKGSCTVIANGRRAGIECYAMDITVGKNCTLHLISELYGIAPESPSYSRKLTVDGTFIAEVTSDKDYATVFQGTEYTMEGNKPITPKLVIGNGNSLFAGSSEAAAEKIDVDAFTAARYVRIGKE